MIAKLAIHEVSTCDKKRKPIPTIKMLLMISDTLEKMGRKKKVERKEAL